VPVRGDVPVLAATVTVKFPGRLLPALAGTAIQGTALDAVQAQPVRVSTVSATAPPPAGTAVFAGVTEKWHGAASCVTATWILLTSTVACRAAGSGLALTL